jgi:hypothetical protein
VLDRVLHYLEAASPVKVVDADTQAAVTDLGKLPSHVALQSGDFGIVGYEWGVTYAGMLLAADAKNLINMAAAEEAVTVAETV